MESNRIGALFERYRPREWSEVLGQDKAVRALCAWRDRFGFGGRAYLITGGTGTGKTTIARILANDLADPFNVQELDATELTPSMIREIEGSLCQYGLGSKSGRAVIINECHRLKPSALTQLLVTLERIPAHVCWILTTTNDGAETLIEDHIDATPLLTRCMPIKLAQRGLCEPFAARIKEILTIEGLDGRDIGYYQNCVKRANNSFRGALETCCFEALADTELASVA